MHLELTLLALSFLPGPSSLPVITQITHVLLRSHDALSLPCAPISSDQRQHLAIRWTPGSDQTRPDGVRASATIDSFDLMLCLDTDASVLVGALVLGEETGRTRKILVSSA